MKLQELRNNWVVRGWCAGEGACPRTDSVSWWAGGVSCVDTEVALHFSVCPRTHGSFWAEILTLQKGVEGRLGKLSPFSFLFRASLRIRSASERV